MAKFYKVGGYVRDKLLGIRSKDVDYAVECESYDAMREAIIARGCSIKLEKPEFLTIRAVEPKVGGVDFVLCRKEGMYKDGRHPEYVEAGTIEDDLARRDFTMNAMALDENDNLIDPFGGELDLGCRIIRCVGNAEERFAEDKLRILRALRFCVTLPPKVTGDGRFQDTLTPVLHNDIMAAISKVDNLDGVSADRVRDELLKAFAAEPLMVMYMLTTMFPRLGKLCFGKLGDAKIQLIPTVVHGD